MNTYSFLVGHKQFTVSAPNKREAMGKANDHFGSLPQGVWMDAQEPNQFWWSLGNYFD